MPCESQVELVTQAELIQLVMECTLSISLFANYPTLSSFCSKMPRIGTSQKHNGHSQSYPHRSDGPGEISDNSDHLIVYENRQQFLELNAISKAEDWKRPRRSERTCVCVRKYRKGIRALQKEDYCDDC